MAAALQLVRRLACDERRVHAGGAVKGTWLIAGARLREPYPCMCRGDGPCRGRCRCRGRVDVEGLPALCCARRETETKERTK